MPYITTHDREQFDDDLEALITTLKSAPIERNYGAVNYCVTRLVTGALKPEQGWSYASLSHAIAVLHDAAHEIERRLMNPHEDRARARNGDIDEYT